MKRACLALLALCACGPDPAPPAPEPTPESTAATSEARPAEIDAETTARLGALGYAEWSPIPEGDRGLRGVTVKDTARMQPGLNLWSSLTGPRAWLMDADGRIVHEWKRGERGEWGHVELLRNGDLLVLQENPNRLVRLRRDSSVVWEQPMLAHHDAYEGPDGEVYVIATAVRSMPTRPGEPRIRVSDDRLVEIGPTGRVGPTHSFLDLLSARPELKPRIRQAIQAPDAPRPIDPIHINTVARIESDGPPPFRDGHILFAARNRDLVGVLDPDARKVTWTWGPGILDWPHQPVLQADGRLLVFDNGSHRGHSRLVELDPRAGDVVWDYEADPRSAFFSRIMGGAQPLPNGNILVTESTRGRVFEITREGDVVWEFFNPQVDPAGARRAGIYRMTRIPAQD